MDRIKRAEELFNAGYNCSQAVVAAFADLYGYSEEQALKLSAGYGGGIGRMRLTCGAACGMFTLAGMDCGSTDAKDKAAKNHVYKVVQQMAKEFETEHGTMICSDLLKQGPCLKQVTSAARIFQEYLDSKQKEIN